MVDIFEAGPIVSCATDDIRTVRESLVSEVFKISGKPIDSDPYIISNTYSQGFRATAAPLAIVPGKGIEIDRETSLILDLKKGDAVRIAPLRQAVKPGHPGLSGHSGNSGHGAKNESRK